MMKPMTLTEQSENYRRVEAAIEYLAERFQEQPDLDQIAAYLSLSKYHFQRIFKEWAGVTPNQFLRYLTVEYAKERLMESRTVLATTMDSGLTSPGRLHDLFVTFEAMTPGEYKAGGEGLDIEFGYHATPFGRCLVALTERGICGLRFLTRETELSDFENLLQEWPRANFKESRNRTGQVIRRLFLTDAEAKERRFHLLLKGTNFQVKVWEGLLAIKPGMLTSYGDLAMQLGKPNAARSVANAVAQNPIAYLIPCHRVIQKVGAYHHYRWGATRKKAMIGWEAVRAARAR